MTTPASPATILAGVVLDGPQGPWTDACRLWLESIRRKSGGDNSVKAYHIAWRQFFTWSAVDPAAVESGLVEQWVTYLAHSGLAPRTINQKLAALSSFYTFVQKHYPHLWPADRINPFTTVDRYHIQPYDQVDVPTGEQIKRILSVINRRCLTGKRDFALFYTYVITTRRLEELLNLKWGHIRPSTHSPGDYFFTYTYKGGRTRKALLPAPCYQAICDYLAADDRLAYMRPDEYIFCRVRQSDHLRNVQSQPGRRISGAQANKALKKYARWADVDERLAHVHNLRHGGLRAHLKAMRDAGRVDLEELMNLAGHSSLSVTQIYIGHAHQEPESSTSRSVAEEFMPAQKQPPQPAQSPGLVELRDQLASLQKQIEAVKNNQ